MNQTQRLEEVVTRLTSEQYARLLSFAESLVAETSQSDFQSTKTFSDGSRQRLRELTDKSESETLTESERAEYIALAEQRENADAARLQEAAQLSKQNNIPLTEALAQLDAGAN
jgi:hypothetical protein